MTLEEAQALFRYDRATGKLFWRKPGIKRNLFKEAGHKGADGYIRVMLQGKMYTAQRIIWFIEYGYWPLIVDHIDRNRSNNRLENLRESDYSLNALNSKTHINNRLGIKGVSYEPRTGRYYARFMRINLGTFDTIEEATEAYSRAVRDY